MSDELPSNMGDLAQCILHPTDFTEQSDAALAHALRLALSNRAELHLLHAGSATEEEWETFPSIRRILQRWGVIAEGAPRSAVRDLGIEIRKVLSTCPNVVDSIDEYCQRHAIDMMILATSARHGLASWIKPSTAERAAERVAFASIPTLFVPGECHGCVSLADGSVQMDHVLVPVDHQPSSDVAIERGLRAIAMYGKEQAKLTLLHVGSESDFPDVSIPKGNWTIERIVRRGNPAGEILDTAEQSKANLIIMVTMGTHGVLDILRGTTTEQVMRQSPCPVLAVPANTFG